MVRRPNKLLDKSGVDAPKADWDCSLATTLVFHRGPGFRHPRKAFGLLRFAHVGISCNARQAQLSLVPDTHRSHQVGLSPQCGIAIPLLVFNCDLLARHHRSQAFTGSQSIRLLSFRRHQCRLNGFCVPYSWHRGRRSYAIRNLDDLAGEGVGEGRCPDDNQDSQRK